MTRLATYEEVAESVRAAPPRLGRTRLVAVDGYGGSFRPTDWVNGGLQPDPIEVTPQDVIILEGVSSARTAVAGRLSYAIWVEAPADRRLERGLERDGEDARPLWEGWMAEEDDWFAKDATQDRVDLIVDGDPEAVHDPDRELVVLER